MRENVPSSTVLSAEQRKRESTAHLGITWHVMPKYRQFNYTMAVKSKWTFSRIIILLVVANTGWKVEGENYLASCQVCDFSVLIGCSHVTWPQVYYL